MIVRWTGVVEDRGEDRECVVAVVGQLDESRLLWIVDVRGGVDLPEAARVVSALMRRDLVAVAVAVDPRDQAR